ncbi:MAG TPA: mannose-1-phosphate guanylyltransferase/mannose-6-phosphate isomerase [Verrucomicrobiae bacterium]|nr:mannose-1-phosphate guanylyltransferase/mannose-6-phosphate isomerase [Verrucomicrobiae bacterium]
MARSLVPVLMAGGSGTRLWPLSREMYPKQLLKLTNERSLLQNTALRAQEIPGAQPPVVICGEQHRFLVAEQLRECGIEGATVILEPEGRNTAPAATVAALFAQDKYGPETQVFLMSADHAFTREAGFIKAVSAASMAAEGGRLMTFGIKPTRPETGYGYLKPGAPLKGAKSARAVAAFVEKPDAKKAARFIKAGYFWNGGIFLFRSDAFLAEVKRLEPAMLAACTDALGKGQRDKDFVRLDKASFTAARKESIDYAIMEKASDIALVPLDAGWDDVGTWSFLGNLPATDKHGNFTRGDVFLQDVEDSMIHAEGRLVAAVGIRDHIVVETRDAVLVTTRDRAQDVKKIVESLKAKKRPEAQDHPKVFRPWGWYDSIANAPGFQVKRIGVKPGQKLSLQMHHKRAEHWIVVKGTAKVTIDERVFDLTTNQSCFIPLGAKHRLENTTGDALELVEVQCGSYLGEDDIVRFDDIYGRAG